MFLIPETGTILKKGENQETAPSSPQIYTPITIITANVYVALEILKCILTCSHKQKKHKFSIEKMFLCHFV